MWRDWQISRNINDYWGSMAETEAAWLASEAVR